MQTMWPRPLAERWMKAEVMDQPGLPATEHHRALRALARINWISRSPGMLSTPIEVVACENRPRPIRVLDLACGGGDGVVALARSFARRGFNIQWSGCDLSNIAVGHAREHAEGNRVRVEFFECDVVSEEIPANFDVVMCSLFLHHLTEDQAVALLSKMGAAAGRMVLVNDLVRSTAGYLLAQAACRFLTRSRVVRNDGPLSVANAFTTKEMQRLASAAGLSGAKIVRHWPARMLLEWRKA